MRGVTGPPERSQQIEGAAVGLAQWHHCTRTRTHKGSHARRLARAQVEREPYTGPVIEV